MHVSQPGRTAGQNDTPRSAPKNGFWRGLLMGLGAISYLGHRPTPPALYPQDAMARDLERIGADMYAGLRKFNEENSA